MDINEIKKELYKSKVNAIFSHYQVVDGIGYLFYTIHLEAGLYQLQIPTTELFTPEEPLYTYYMKDEEFVPCTNVEICVQHSKDLGTTPFNNEIKASELNRWITKAIENNTFIRVA